jgi:hypothetical protein
LRTSVGPDVTFFHLISSAPGWLKCCLNEIPATLVPTLLSADAAKDANEVYLGIHLWLFDKCGPDAIAIATLRSQQSPARKPARKPTSRR